MMEPEARSQDVNVYITVDPSSMLESRNSRRIKQKKRDWSIDFIQDYLVSAEYLEYLLTPLGVLMMFEIVFALTLLLLSAITPPWHMGYGCGVYGIVANALTLLVLLLLVVLSCCFVANVWRPSILFLLALKILIRVFLLILQGVAFILMMANGDWYPEQIAFIVITVIYCCVLIVTIVLYSEEFSRHANTRQTSVVTKKQKIRRGKQKGYKRLSKSGYR